MHEIMWHTTSNIVLPRRGTLFLPQCGRSFATIDPEVAERQKWHTTSNIVATGSWSNGEDEADGTVGNLKPGMDYLYAPQNTQRGRQGTETEYAVSASQSPWAELAQDVEHLFCPLCPSLERESDIATCQPFVGMTGVRFDIGVTAISLIFNTPLERIAANRAQYIFVWL